MNTPKPKVAKGPIFEDANGELPALGTMNYTRKFSEGASGGYSAPGMPVQIGRATYLPKKKKTALPIAATYRQGTKSVQTGPGKDVERATPSVTAAPEYPVATSPFSEVDGGDPDLSTTNLAPVAEQPRASLQAAKPLPADRNAGKRKPKDYKEAAAVIKGDKSLYAQYKAGVASGKAFTLTVGGKDFKYAATPQKREDASPISQEKIRSTFYGDDKPVVKKSMKAIPTPGLEERAELLQKVPESIPTPEDDNAAIKAANSRKMSGKKK